MRIDKLARRLKLTYLEAYKEMVGAERYAIEMGHNSWEWDTAA